MKRLVLTVTLLMTVSVTFAQKVMSDPQYIEIIMSYNHGEGETKELALKQLLNRLKDALNDVNDNDIVYAKYKDANGKISIVAYIDKTVPNNTDKGIHVETLILQPKVEKKPESQPALQAKVEVKNDTMEQPTPAPPAPTPKPAVGSSNDIVNTLINLSNQEEFERQLNRYKRQGKLFVNEGEIAPAPVEKCLIAVFKNEQLSALYDTGTATRTNLLNNEIYNTTDIINNNQNSHIILIKLN